MTEKNYNLGKFDNDLELFDQFRDYISNMTSIKNALDFMLNKECQQAAQCYEFFTNQKSEQIYIDIRNILGFTGQKDLMRRDDSGINVKTTLCSAAARNLEVIILGEGYGQFLYERGNKGRMMSMYEYKVTLEKAKRKRFSVERDINLEIIVGDFMTKYLNGCEVSRDNSVKIKCHPGATTDNVIDYVRLSGRKKPDMIIIHTGTNDIQNKVNTLQKVRKVITTMKEINVNNEIQIAFSSVIHCEDQDFEEEIKEINRKL